MMHSREKCYAEIVSIGGDDPRMTWRLFEAYIGCSGALFYTLMPDGLDE